MFRLDLRATADEKLRQHKKETKPLINTTSPALCQEDQLRALLVELPESLGVMRINCEIANYPSFFPGGKGFKGKSFPRSPVMLIGHNFDTDDGFRLSVDRGHEDPKMPTWRNLRESFLKTAAIEEADCFFTNFYLGAKVHPRKKNTGSFPCSRSYREACVNALRKQVEIVRPRAIGLLGARVPLAFAKAFPIYQPLLGRNLTETQSKQPKGGHLLRLLPDLQVRIVSLFHPSNPRSTKLHCAQGLHLMACVQSPTFEQMAGAERIMKKRHDVLEALAS